MKVNLLLSEDFAGVLAIILPPSVKMKIAQTPAADKGGSKQAITETGLRLIVPQFIESGDSVEINTELLSFMRRA